MFIYVGGGFLKLKKIRELILAEACEVVGLKGTTNKVILSECLEVNTGAQS